MNDHGTTAVIDLNALRNNIDVIKKMAPNSKILAMVKRNAYGHGAVKISQILEKENKANTFGVACLNEAITLHDAGIKTPILMLKGFVDAEELKIIDKYKFATLIHNNEQLDILEKTKLNNPLTVWLKIDSGMHRLGFQKNLAENAYKRLMNNEQVTKPLFLMTHMSDADSPEKPKTENQLKAFAEITANFQGLKTIANSATIITHKEAHADVVRPGITMFGVSPFADKTVLEYGFQPVMTLESTLIAIQHLAKGETVGYGSTWTAPEEMRIGIVNTGYGDGYPRTSKTPPMVMINNKKGPLVGRVAMDMLNVDLRTIPEAKVGDRVTLWGKGLPIEEVASHLGTVPYELFCQLTQRVIYKYINE